MSTETTLEEHLGGAVKIWQDALEMIRTRKGIDDEERQRWTELYEYELARVRGEGVTRAEVGKFRARLEGWLILRSALPTKTPPGDDGFELYVAVQKRLLEYRRGGERVPAEEVERASRFGRAAFLRWWDPIEDQLCAIDRAIRKLNHFGNEDDTGDVDRLEQRGDNLFRWLRYQQSSGLLPWLPPYHWHPHPLDAEWCDAKSSSHKDVCAWWESRTA